MSILYAVVLAFLVLVSPSARGAASTTVVDVPVEGHVQRFLYVRPDAPVANIIDIPGGEGALGIQDDGSMTTVTAQCNPVARNRQAFADHGYALALVDADSLGVAYDLNDLLAVASYMQARDNVPTWVIGGSSSTNAVANLAVSLPAGSPVGIIFFAPEHLSASLAPRITRDTLVIFHSADTLTTPGATYTALTSAPVKELVGLSGGNNGGCGYHLFNGLDPEFVAATAGFIDKYNASLGGGTSSTSVAVEYYYDVWNFYFETSFADEIAALDGGAFGGAWKRTGETFKVWSSASTPAAVPTCRFFSTAFSPRSSHFYTPFENECAIRKADPGWHFEAIAFYVQLTDANGFCPAGTIPLYRVYNNGMGGAPNHRYTTSRATRDLMLMLAWSAEGNGPDIIFACVPA